MKSTFVNRVHEEELTKGQSRAIITELK